MEAWGDLNIQNYSMLSWRRKIVAPKKFHGCACGCEDGVGARRWKPHGDPRLACCIPCHGDEETFKEKITEIKYIWKEADQNY